MSISAYRRTISDTETPRQAERRILKQINARIAQHADHFDGATENTVKMEILHGSLAPALSDNLKLWSALKIDLMSPENDLSSEVRANLISLALFVERQTREILGGRANVKPLVDLNKSIIDGLSGIAPETA